MRRVEASKKKLRRGILSTNDVRSSNEVVEAHRRATKAGLEQAGKSAIKAGLLGLELMKQDNGRILQLLQTINTMCPMTAIEMDLLYQVYISHITTASMYNYLEDPGMRHTERSSPIDPLKKGSAGT